jgi:hypothetical protein
MLNRLKDVFWYFQKHDVKYVVIGGIAAVMHGVPRTTFDLDILIEAKADNVQKLLEALLDAGFGTAALTNTNEILNHDITIFKDRVRVDVQTSTPGIEFQDVWKNKKIVRHNNQDFFILSIDDLITSKVASGRKVDLEDVEVLKKKKGK